MAILRPVCKYQYELTLESDDGELYYPSSFTKTNGFNVKLSDNYAYFDPIEISTDYDPVYFRDLVKYCIKASASSVTEESFREKRFTLSFHFPDSSVMRDEGYCAYDCRLIGFKFMELDRRIEAEKEPDLGTSLLTLTFQPRYIGFYRNKVG